MKYSILFAVVGLVSMGAIPNSNLFAQTQANTTTAGQTQAAAPAEQKTVGFRLTEWKTFHSHDAAATEKLVNTMEEIGCEVTQTSHGDHMDVKYRCADWKMITVENNEYAVQWAGWLGEHGMETVMVNPPESAAVNSVKFRLGDWRAAHLHDANQAAVYESMLKMIGCEVESQNHDGHIDVKFRCQQWTTIALHSHDAVHNWQAWLNANGFETEHEH